MLLTAHRAKGLEFDHVVVLDGGWDRSGRNEDSDAPRRLYYVAMTRARETLTLAAFDRGNALLSGLQDQESVLVRPEAEIGEPAPELARKYIRATLSDVDLGFAGRFAPSHAVHGAIAALAPGDSLSLVRAADRFELVDGRGNRVARLARAFSPPEGMLCLQARVAAIVERFRDDSEPEYQEQLRCDRWEVVIPELIFDRANG